MAAPAPLTLEEIELLEPNYPGPTWQKDAFNRWKLPEQDARLADRRLVRS
jgi:hypothetical protein